MATDFDTTELQALEAFYNDLSDVDKRKVFIASFRKAGKILLDKVKPQLPRRTGNLQNSLGIRPVGNDISVDVGAFRGGGKKGWHGHLIENGTKERYRRTRSGASTGRISPDPIWEQTYGQTEEQMLQAISDEWYDTIYQFGMKRFKKMT
jgi:hypothetical protein